MIKHPIIETELFYCESVLYASSYELKTFAPLYGVDSLAKYLKSKAREHEEKLIERTYTVRDSKTGAIAG